MEGKLHRFVSHLPVAVVPILEPRVSGNIRLMWITPTPTSGVMADVKMDELCTSTVRPAPSRIAISLQGYGVDTWRPALWNQKQQGYLCVLQLVLVHSKSRC